LQDAVVNGEEQQSSLLDEYYLRDKAEPTISILSDKHKVSGFRRLSEDK